MPRRSPRRERLPFVLERVTDGDAAVRHQALLTLEAAANAHLITGRQILQLRANTGALVGADGVDPGDTLCRIADRGPSAPSHPAMKAFYAALCAAGAAAGKPADFVEATDRARALWDRLPLDAPEEVRLHDARGSMSCWATDRRRVGTAPTSRVGSPGPAHRDASSR